jgi:hypothetical protein
MNNSDNIQLEKIAVHKVGNKLQGEDLTLSANILPVRESLIKELLLKYFLSPFKSTEYYHLAHASELALNEVYAFASSIFADPKTFLQMSLNMAKHLYEKSNHPKIKGGELYVVYFSDCFVDGETTEAIGLFKSETKDTYLKIMPTPDNFEIGHEDGININKLDKGCMIFNVEREKGYKVSIVDQTNRSEEAQYWKDHFLQVKAREDAFFHTKNYLDLCKNFIQGELREKFEVSRADEVVMMNKSADYFKKKETFDLNEFTTEIIGQPDIIDAFKDYRKTFQEERTIPVYDEFSISAAAVKKSSRVFKSVIKLDKNFHIYVHGNRDNIIKGFDESSGLHFYQLFFKEEK